VEKLQAWMSLEHAVSEFLIIVVIYIISIFQDVRINTEAGIIRYDQHQTIKLFNSGAKF
jgi:hypothetical protein